MRAKIVAPIRNTMRLVYYQQRNASSNRPQHFRAKMLVGQPFRCNQQDIHFISCQRRLYLMPFLLIFRVDGSGSDPIRKAAAI